MSFQVKDCTLITRMAGIDTALNLRELRERVKIVPTECLFHHFCETVIRPAFDDPEYRNDFAIWASRDLRDRILAERLGVLNPYTFESLDELRHRLVEIIDDRLAELPNIPWVPKGLDFRFMQAVTVVFETDLTLETQYDLIEHLPDMSPGSIYYHFVESRRRTNDHIDDFSLWLKGLDEDSSEIRNTLGSIDFYFLTLPTLRRRLIETVGDIKIKEQSGDTPA